MSMTGDRKRLFDKAVRAHQAGELTEAVSIYETLLQAEADAAVTGLLGAALTQDGRLEEGLARLDEASTAAPQDVTILNNYAHALCLARRFEEAERIYAQALEQEPSDEQMFSRLFALCNENGRFERVIEAAERRLNRDPDDIDAHVTLADAYLMTGDLERGWAEFEWRWKAAGYVRSFVPPPVRTSSLAESNPSATNVYSSVPAPPLVKRPSQSVGPPTGESAVLASSSSSPVL